VGNVLQCVLHVDLLRGGAQRGEVDRVPRRTALLLGAGLCPQRAVAFRRDGPVLDVVLVGVFGGVLDGVVDDGVLSGVPD
jgi:hypothetical protein